MTLTMKKVSVWETSDGEKHSSKEMAEHYILNAELRDYFEERLAGDRIDGQELVNLISGHMKAIRAFFDACDAMEKAALK